MAITPAAGTASAVLALSRSARKLGIALSKLHQNSQFADSTVKDLSGAVKSLGIEFDLVYAELEKVISKSAAGLPPQYHVDDRIWTCLSAQVEETSKIIHEVDLFVNCGSGEESGPEGQAERQRRLSKSNDQIKSFENKVYRRVDNLHITVLLLKAVFVRLVPCRADRRLSQELEELYRMINKLQISSEDRPQSQSSHIEATLMQCAREVIMEGTTMHEAGTAAEFVTRSQSRPNQTRDVMEWVRTLDSIRMEQEYLKSPDREPESSSRFPVQRKPVQRKHSAGPHAISAQRAEQKHEAVDILEHDSDDDLSADLAEAALDTGTFAFEAREWREADSLFQEALRVLQQLPTQKRAFCDILSLHYKLAVCAYYTQDSIRGEEALMSLKRQSVSCDEHRGYIDDVTHLLSQLHIRIGQVNRARSECEKALQSRRRLLGKQSDASLESTALMAHIDVLLNNRARAKSWLAMIPESRRDAIIRKVEDSLGIGLDHLEFSTLLTRSISGKSDLGPTRIQSTQSSPTLGETLENRCSKPVHTMIESPVASLRQPHQGMSTNRTRSADLHSVTAVSLSSAEGVSEWRSLKKETPSEGYPTDPIEYGAATRSPGETQEASETFKGRVRSRKEILDKVGCQPRDRIEEAVCDGDHAALVNLLNKKKGSWREKLRKHVRPERVTALHFAALFGELDMAQRLLGSGFNINEVPYGYTTSLTSLKFAIGARQVDMVRFLIANGAEPSEPESWSTLAGQLMSRSWLLKTMSEPEKDLIPGRIVAILGVLLEQGLDVNAPFETSGRTLLHQAVTFWTGSYHWDLNLRTAITSFLCEQGADPFHADLEGKTPYDMASASGHQDLLLVLGRHSKWKELSGGSSEPVELSG